MVEITGISELSFKNKNRTVFDIKLYYTSLMWFKIQNQQVKIEVYAKPNAKKTALVGIDERLHIMLHAKPEDGAANKELILYLAKLFNVPKSRIILQKGATSRYKQFVIPLTNQVQEYLDNPQVWQSKMKV